MKEVKMKRDGSMEPIALELLAYGEELKNNPNAEPPEVLASAMKRGHALAEKCLDILKDSDEFFTTDTKDNARVLFFASVKASMMFGYLMSTFTGSDIEQSLKVMDALQAIKDKIEDEKEK